MVFSWDFMVFHGILWYFHGISWDIWWLNLLSMGDLQDPIHGGTVLVPYFWPYFVGIFPEIKAWKIGLIYGRYLQFRILEWPLNLVIMKSVLIVFTIIIAIMKKLLVLSSILLLFRCCCKKPDHHDAYHLLVVTLSLLYYIIWWSYIININ